MPPLPTLVCKACGYVNEGERVYCHGCGAKLDRELIIAQHPVVPLEQKQREVKKIMTPKNPLFPGFWKNLVKTVALAAVAGALVDAALPPGGTIPATAQKEAVLASPPQIDMVMEALSIATDGQRKAVSEADLNAYLQKEHFRKVPKWLTDYLPLHRVFVNLEEGGGRLSIQASLFHYPLYAGLTGRVQSTGPGKLTAVCTGGFIGRLHLPAAVACYAGAAVPVLLDSLKRDRQLLEQLGSVEIAQKRLILGAPRVAAARPLPGTTPAPARPAVTR
ncbi:MAG: hypothetical protein WCH57_11060 [Verrucomicrobiota bacterium]